MATRDYYEVLEVERTIDAAGLKAAYRKLAMKHHPDKNGGCDDSMARFKEISEAYSVLSDDQKRAAYDRFGHAGVQTISSGVEHSLRRRWRRRNWLLCSLNTPSNLRGAVLVDMHRCPRYVRDLDVSALGGRIRGPDEFVRLQ